MIGSIYVITHNAISAMDIQRLRNLTTGRLHTEMQHIDEWFCPKEDFRLLD